MKTIIAVVETAKTRFKVFRTGHDILEHEGEIPTYDDYKQWVQALAAAFKPHLTMGTTHAVMVVMPCSIDELHSKLIGFNGSHTSWAGTRPTSGLQAELKVPLRIFMMEGATALLNSENLRASAPAKLAFSWDAGITAAVTDADSIAGIAAGHLPSLVRYNSKCACGQHDCIGTIIDGTALMRAFTHPPANFTPEEWKRAIHRFIGYALVPIAIAYPGASIVVGGEIFDAAVESGVDPLTQMKQGLRNKLPGAVTTHLISGAEMTDPQADGGLIMMNSILYPTLP